MTLWMNLPMTGLPPGCTTTLAGSNERPRRAPTSAAKASRRGMMPAAAQYPVMPSAIALSMASTTFAGVGRFMSPRWNGNTRLPFAAHSAAASETAKAVSVPRFWRREASCIGAVYI
jgi:hypothetical protein